MFKHYIRVIAGVVLLCAVACGSGCGKKATSLAAAPNLYVHMEDDPYGSVPPELQSSTASVVYATDRLAETVEGQFKYTAKRCREVSYGLCTVQIGPEGTTWEQLVKASCSPKHDEPLPLAVTHIDERGRYPVLGAAVEVDGRWQDDPKWIEQCAARDQELHAIIAEQLAKTPRKELIVFVHGYNNTFESSAYRAAQLWHYAGRGGVPVVFSWPAGSSGLLQGYTRDRESGEFANPHLKHFLWAISRTPGVDKIHLVAHSRGTDVLATAVRELHIQCRGGNLDTRSELKLGQIILAAPDMDLDVFIERFSADRVGLVAEGLTIYVSPNDKAIGLSNWLFGSRRRIGQLAFGDLTPEGQKQVKRHPVMAIVDVRAKTDRRGHGYFISSPAALSDVILVLRDKRRPGAEHGRPLSDNPHGFWQVHDGYPVTAPDTR